MSRNIRIVVSVMLSMIIAVSVIFIVSVEYAVDLPGDNAYFNDEWETEALPASMESINESEASVAANRAVDAVSGMRNVWLIQIGLIILLALMSLLFLNYSRTPKNISNKE